MIRFLTVYSIVFLFPLILSGCIPYYTDFSQTDISEIRVSKFKSNQEYIIHQPEQLDEINRLWRQLEPVDEKPEVDWNYKLNIHDRGGGGGTWLYNEEGYVVLLTYELKPVYRVKEPAVFKKLILGF